MRLHFSLIEKVGILESLKIVWSGGTVDSCRCRVDRYTEGISFDMPQNAYEAFVDVLNM